MGPSLLVIVFDILFDCLALHELHDHVYRLPTLVNEGVLHLDYPLMIQFLKHFVLPDCDLLVLLVDAADNFHCKFLGLVL